MLGDMCVGRGGRGRRDDISVCIPSMYACIYPSMHACMCVSIMSQCKLCAGENRDILSYKNMLFGRMSRLIFNVSVGIA